MCKLSSNHQHIFDLLNKHPVEIGRMEYKGEDGMSDASDCGANLYRTSDIYFASFLCSLDFTLEATENKKNADGHKKVVFVFKIAGEHLRRAKAGYFGGTSTIKARKFVDNIRSLKSMCFI